jgi:hypothetical protein
MIGTALAICPLADHLRTALQRQADSFGGKKAPETPLEQLCAGILSPSGWANFTQAVERVCVLHMAPELHRELVFLRDTYQRVLSSQPLRYALRILLAIGNFVNTSNGRRTANYFTIDSACKAADVKAGDGRTAMHALVCVLQRDYPDGLDSLIDLADALPRAINCQVTCRRRKTEALPKS